MPASPVQRVAESCQKLKENIQKVIIGKEEAIELVTVALLAGGHILAEDVPGVGKTMLARSFATSLGCKFSRIQFTPDLLPSDVTGVSVFNQKLSEFEFRPGPIMAQIVLADEINRATPRTQSSLLECMEERQITIDGQTRRLEQPFLVMATQNPIEYEGTFPLPEAQMDRFLVKIKLGHPSAAEENQILLRLQKEHPIDSLGQVMDAQEIVELQKMIREVHVEDSVREYIVNLVHETRSHPDLALGSSPRGALALYRTGQALAAIHGRDYVLPDDIKSLVRPTLSHRLIIKPESQLRGRTAEKILSEILERVPVVLEEGTA